MRKSLNKDSDRYLERIGIHHDDVHGHTIETLQTLQSAHVQSVPFETLAITGGPNHTFQGEQVNLNIDEIYHKIVEEQRGGWCFELNGLFGWLLNELGFNAEYLAARMLSSELIPANHLALLVSLDEDLLVDVGLGIPTMRQPIPLGGKSDQDESGVCWRMIETNRHDVNYITQFRMPSEPQWTNRYAIDVKPRSLQYFEATSDFLSTAPESPFTGTPVVTRATKEGHLKLNRDEYSQFKKIDECTIEVSSDKWVEILMEKFGISVR